MTECQISDITEQPSGGVLRERLAGTMGRVAFGAGIASAVLFFAAIVFFTGPALTANDTSKFHRWFTRAGVVVLLFAVFFLPAFLYWAWILVASILLARQPRTSAAAIPQPA